MAMPRASRLGAVGLAVAALLISTAWRDESPKVEHALVPVGQFTVEVWHDPAVGELALRYQGADDLMILDGRTRYDLIEGQLSNVTVYMNAVGLWKPVTTRYGVTAEQVSAALSSGDRVDRPSLMDIPNLVRPSRPYYFVRDFGTQVRVLRRAARFPVPAPGPVLAGLQLAHVTLSQTRGPGRLVDGVYVASLSYSADPEHIGTGERQLGVESASVRSPAGDSYRQFFATSRRRLVGRGYDARLTDSGVILRYHGIYVLVFPRWDASLAELRAVLSKVARS
jgi:hypothetical protein